VDVGAVAVAVEVAVGAAGGTGRAHAPLALQTFGDTQSLSAVHVSKHVPVPTSQR
jgi:hypothetical protein